MVNNVVFAVIIKLMLIVISLGEVLKKYKHESSPPLENKYIWSYVEPQIALLKIANQP